MRKMRFYRAARAIFGPVFRLIFRVRVNGLENVPAEGGILIASNHISMLDPILLGATIGRPIRFMAKSSLFRIPLLHGLLNLLGAFPINRGSADPASLRTAINSIKEGDAVGIYPQGTRYKKKDPRETETRSGAGLIVYRAGCGVLPVSIKTKGYNVVPFRRVYINIGKPLSHGEIAPSSPFKAEYGRSSEMIFSHILSLLDGGENDE